MACQSPPPTSLPLFAAHEITHAFDDVGIQYDEFGRFSPLYDNQTVADFHESSDCVRCVQAFAHPWAMP